MKNKVIKKIFIIYVIFLVIGILPSIGANETKYILKNNYKTKTEPKIQDLIFSDNFDDNKKDVTKWTEIMYGGEWYERNSQLEFRKYEVASSNREGIESIGIPVTLKTVPLRIECVMDTFIENYPSGGQWVGQTHVNIVDAEDPENHYIDVYYRRDNNFIIVSDSSGTEITIGTTDEFKYKVTIIITDDGYTVDVGPYQTDIIPIPIFPEKFIVKLRLFIYLNGDFSDFWWCAGFDDVAITGKKSNPRVSNLNYKLEYYMSEKMITLYKSFMKCLCLLYIH
jgi:hypothetical protein